ncbi:hypothetical protein [Thiopseudomonas alkaliphila]|nr:hypothetical protein [Thiopseudomonas alkaliphila]
MMTEKSRDTRFQVSADRHSGSRRVRYVETSQMSDGECLLCQMDEGGVPVESASPQESPVSDSPTPAIDEQDEDSFVENELAQSIENQLAANNPEFVTAVYNKLTLVETPRDEIIALMAQVLAWEISAMLEQDRPFDLVRYEQGLRALPSLPEED